MAYYLEKLEKNDLSDHIEINILSVAIKAITLFTHEYEIKEYIQNNLANYTADPGTLLQYKITVQKQEISDEDFETEQNRFIYFKLNAFYIMCDVKYKNK